MRIDETARRPRLPWNDDNLLIESAHSSDERRGRIGRKARDRGNVAGLAAGALQIAAESPLGY